MLSCLLLVTPPIAVATSLFDEATYKPIITDHRAYKVGDLITVLIYEAATAVSSTNAKTQKSTGIGVGYSGDSNSLDESLSLSSDFNGGGELNRSDQVKATVSVSVVEVEEGGLLVVKGEQKISFNNESQIISVSGRVRTVDISPQNTVLSSRIADGDIKYIGDGLLSDRQKPGWITRFFNWLF